MKRINFFFSHTLFFLFSVSSPFISLAQCSGSCPTGALTTLPAGGTIAAGTTYCIAGPVTNTTAYTINGTLIISSGSVSIGSVTLNKTGSILVSSSAKLSTGNFTGQSTAPASTIDNITVCTGGFLSISGAFNQWETNIVLNDYAVLLVTGSWTSSATDIYAKIGTAALVDLCGTLNINSNGFFTETTTSPSYLITGGGVSESIVNGWLSTKQSASLLKWTSLATSAFVSHPAAYTCNGCGNNSMAPTGITPAVGSCSADANAYLLTVLPLSIRNFYEQMTSQSLQLIAELYADLPVRQVILESSADGSNFAAAPYTATVADGIGSDAADGASVKYLFTLPLSGSGKYYRVHVLGDGTALYSSILSPDGQAEQAAGFVFPDPATNFVYLSFKANNKFTTACLISNMGQVLQRSALPSSVTTVRFDLPASLAAGIYFIKVTGPGEAPLIARVLKK